MRTDTSMSDGHWEPRDPDPRVTWSDVVSAWLFVAAVAVLALVL